MIVWQKVKDFLKDNLSFLPTLMGFASLLAACVLLWGEWNGYLSFGQVDLSVESYRVVTNTLGVLLGAIVTIFGIILPITFSMLLRAASQYTPMVLRIYRREKRLKILLGLMFATTVYLIVLLAAISFFQDGGAPVIALAVAVLLIALTIGTIPAFFDHFVFSLEPVYLASAIAKDLKSMLSDFSQSGEEIKLEAHQDRSQLQPSLYLHTVSAESSGYVQSVDKEKLCRFFEEKKLKGAVVVRTGDFVVRNTPLVYYNNIDQEPSELRDPILDCISVGKKRKRISDLELQLDELVSITVKALSPGVNDLSTATQVINHIGNITNLLLNSPFERGVHEDSEGTTRLYTKEFDFFGFAHAAFDRIRQNSADQSAVTIRLVALIADLIGNSESDERSRALRTIAHEIADNATLENESTDRKQVEEILEKIDVEETGFRP